MTGLEGRTGDLPSVSARLAVIEERVGGVMKGMEEGGRKKWAVLAALAGAIGGALLTGLVNLLLAEWRR